MWSNRSQAGGKAIAIRADVSKIEDVRRLFEKVTEQFEGLDMSRSFRWTCSIFVLSNCLGLLLPRPHDLLDGTDE